ncbi:AAA family ATPase [Actinomadura alba]|uniref:AAA family ATPase n=2 Tax=Actinomadura alba TaxID=406431 RepID=A0ABR7LTA1_9ACTN|nr:AAA family ATPase [Actinomadura alba]
MTSPMSELAELFAATGVPAAQVARVTSRLGDSAAARLREDPWRLLLVPGVGPGQADGFARRVLGPEATPGDERRCRALVTHLLMNAARAGHTATPLPDVLAELAKLRVPDPPRAVEAALDEAAVMAFIEEPDEAEDFDDMADFGAAGAPDGEPPEPPQTLAPARYGLAEEAVAEGVVRLAATAEPLLDEPALEAAPAGPAGGHGAAVTAAVRYGVSVVTGSPADVEPAITALAGAAAAGGRRVAVATATALATAAVTVPAGTTVEPLHRLLDAREVEGGIAFARGEQAPLDFDLVIVQEASALDVELAAALVEACADGTHLVLCGDPAVLPPVGPGRVLADLAESETVPVVSVNAAEDPATGAEGGAVRRLAAAVGRGELPEVDSPEREVVVVAASGDGEAVHRAVQLVIDSIPRALGIPVEDVQVVTPAWSGDAGAAALNRALKDRLNPGPGEHAGFDVGDRVVVYGALAQAPTGETGVVTAADERELEVAFAAGPVTVPVPLLPRLRHGWAITAAQAHGTRWPAVVAVLPAEAAGQLSRPMVVTAFTRARRHLSVVQAAGPALARAVGSPDTPGSRRRTRLVGLLRG